MYEIFRKSRALFSRNARLLYFSSSFSINLQIKNNLTTYLVELLPDHCPAIEHVEKASKTDTQTLLFSKHTLLLSAPFCYKRWLCLLKANAP